MRVAHGSNMMDLQNQIFAPSCVSELSDEIVASDVIIMFQFKEKFGIDPELLTSEQIDKVFTNRTSGKKCRFGKHDTITISDPKSSYDIKYCTRCGKKFFKAK